MTDLVGLNNLQKRKQILNDEDLTFPSIIGAIDTVLTSDGVGGSVWKVNNSAENFAFGSMYYNHPIGNIGAVFDYDAVNVYKHLNNATLAYIPYCLNLFFHNDGVLTYNGTVTRIFRFEWTVGLEKQGGGNINDVHMAVFAGNPRVIIPASDVRLRIGSNAANTMSSTALMQLNPGDEVALHSKNSTNLESVEIWDISCTVSQVSQTM